MDVAEVVRTSTHYRSVFSVEFCVPGVDLARHRDMHGGKVGECGYLGAGEATKGVEEEVVCYNPRQIG